MADMKKNQRKKRGFLPVLLLIIFLTSFATCAYLIYGEVNKELGIHNMETNIQSFVKPTNDTSDDTEHGAENEDTYTFDWDGMMAQSKYIVGWIQMPGIKRINYPIVQTDDNQFFLTHDWTGANQTAGAIFLNKNNSPDFSDMNSIVYGHRMKAGSMFGLLKYYEKQDFLDENPYFYIYKPDGCKMTYEIICCAHVKDGSDAYRLHFESPDERMAYYNMMIYNAVTKRDTKLDRLDTTMMLSTCNSSAGYYERITLLGKLIAIDINGQPEDWESE